jgi:DnaK suppressor protein
MASRKSDTKSKTTKTAKTTARTKSAKAAKSPARAKSATASRSKTAGRAKAAGSAKTTATKATRTNRAAVSKNTASKTSVSRSGTRRTTANRAETSRPAVARPAPALRPVPAGPVYEPGDRDRFEGILLEVRTRLLKEMGHLEDTVLNRSLRDSSGELSGYSFHMADIGTDAMEREKAFLFASSEGRALLDINEALRRLYNGEYGNCEVCGNPISTARLEVVPQARMCVSCKQEEERSQGGRGR